jgi:hypothetical protein
MWKRLHRVHLARGTGLCLHAGAVILMCTFPETVAVGAFSMASVTGGRLPVGLTDF